MTLRQGNLFHDLPVPAEAEHLRTLACAPGCSVVHIVSDGHASPPDFWYDQADDEWVVLLQGGANLEFESGEHFTLTPGDWLHLSAGPRHRVVSTALRTVWLAVHLAPRNDRSESSRDDPAG